MSDETNTSAPEPSAETTPQPAAEAAPVAPASEAPAPDQPMFPQPTMEAITASLDHAEGKPAAGREQ